MSVIMMGGEGCVRDLEGLGGITGGIFLEKRPLRCPWLLHITGISLP